MGLVPVPDGPPAQVWDFSPDPPERGLTPVTSPSARPNTYVDPVTGAETWSLYYFAELSGEPFDWRTCLRFEQPDDYVAALFELTRHERTRERIDGPTVVTITKAHPALAGPLPGEGTAA